MVGECGSCKAPVHWAITPSGKRAPIDYEPQPERGNVLLLKPSTLQSGGDVLLAVTLSGDALELGRRGGHLFLNHWATCPDKAEWRAKQEAKRASKAAD